MLIWIFAILLAFAFGLFWLGYKIENYPAFIASGVAFLLISGGIFISGITIQSGEEIVTEMTCNQTTGYFCPNYNQSTTTSYQYSDAPIGADFLSGTLFLIMSFFAFGCAVIYASHKRDREY